MDVLPGRSLSGITPGRPGRPLAGRWA